MNNTWEQSATFMYTSRMLEEYGISANKALGQNFLTDMHVLEKILSASAVTKDDTVLEIGPGLGNVTHAVTGRAKKVIAVEADTRFCDILKDTANKFGNLEVINADIMKTPVSQIIKGRFKVISNLPYYIAAAVITMLLESGCEIESMTVMTQKEVGLRLMSQPGCKAYGAMTVMTRYYADVSLLANVPANCFYPRPNVDSALLSIIPRNPLESGVDRDFLFSVIKAAFAHRRKTLVNCLVNASIIPERETAADFLTGLGYDRNIRGETLAPEEFIELAQALAESCFGARAT